jgi:hypothetical protein
MYSLDDAEFYTTVEPILRKVFVVDNPFGEPFSPDIATRKIVYPIYDYPNRNLLEALIKAASTEGDSGCYLSLFWQSEGQPNHCYVPFSELVEGFATPSFGKGIAERLNMCIFPGYILFSEQGRWGLMVSDERHGLLGDSSEFIRIFSEHVPNIDRQVYDFLEVMQDVRTDGSRKKLNWLLQMLSHVYGRENAVKIIKKVEEKL